MMYAGRAASRRIGMHRLRRRGAGEGRGAGAGRPMSEINVTPFVDVMLVLLIVFMIAAPLLSIGVPVELPRSDESAPLPADQQLLTISVTKDGRVFLQDNEVVLEELSVRLRALRRGAAGQARDGEGESSGAGEADAAAATDGAEATDNAAETAAPPPPASGSIYVRGDSQAQYGLMARIIAIVKAAGYRRIGFITENNPEP